MCLRGRSRIFRQIFVSRAAVEWKNWGVVATVLESGRKRTFLPSSSRGIVQTMHKLVILPNSKSPIYLTLYTFQLSSLVAMNSKQPRLFETVFAHQVEYHKIAKTN